MVGTVTARFGTDVVAYPTPYQEYNDAYSWSGILPISTHGRSTCLTETLTTTATIPFHPVMSSKYIIMSAKTTAANPADPKGYRARLDSMAQPIPPGFYMDNFPDVPVFKVCDTPEDDLAAPEEYLLTAVYSTQTSTSHELGSPPSMTHGPAPTLKSSSSVLDLPTVSHPDTSVQSTTSAAPVSVPPPVPSATTAPQTTEQGDIPHGDSSTDGQAGSMSHTASVKGADSPSSSNVPFPDSAQATTAGGESILDRPQSSLNTDESSSSHNENNNEPPAPASSISHPSPAPSAPFEATTAPQQPASQALVIGGTTSFISNPSSAAAQPAMAPQHGAGSQEVASNQGSSNAGQVQAAPTTSAVAVLHINNTPVTGTSNVFVVAGQTLAPSNPVVTVGDSGSGSGAIPGSTVLSLLPSGRGVVAHAINPTGDTPNAVSTIAISTPTPTPAPNLAPESTQPTTAAPPSVITLAGQAYTANTAGVYDVGGQSLAPGGSAIDMEGTRVSLGAIPTVPAATSSSRAVVTLAGQVYTANMAGAYSIAGQRLAPGGPAVTLSAGTAVGTAAATVYSLASNEADIVVDGVTSTISTAAGSSDSTGMGGYIASGLGPAATTSTGTDIGTGVGVATTPTGTAYIPSSDAVGRMRGAVGVRGATFACVIVVILVG